MWCPYFFALLVIAVHSETSPRSHLILSVAVVLVGLVEVAKVCFCIVLVVCGSKGSERAWSDLSVGYSGVGFGGGSIWGTLSRAPTCGGVVRVAWSLTLVCDGGFVRGT